MGDAMTDMCTVRALDSSNLAVGLAVANWLDGWPSKTANAQTTPLWGQGVDYTRLRIARYDYPILRLSGLWVAGDFQAAVNKAAEVHRMRGRVAAVVMTAAGTTYDWSGDYAFLVHDAKAAPRAGAIFGNGVTGNAHLEVLFTLQLVPIA